MMGQSCALSKSAMTLNKLRVVADMPYCCTAVQKNLNKLGKVADRNLMVFNKCSVLHLERKNSRLKNKGKQPDGKQLCRKRSEGPRGHQVECEAIPKVSVILGCIRRYFASRTREVFFPFSQQW